jgi:hypothetical protein
VRAGGGESPDLCLVALDEKDDLTIDYLVVTVFACDSNRDWCGLSVGKIVERRGGPPVRSTRIERRSCRRTAEEQGEDRANCAVDGGNDAGEESSASGVG